jgi:hypothetical protein
LLQQIPEVKISNYFFKNNGDITFANVTKAWGVYQPSFSNGAAYADFDNDGDMDIVVNNINDAATVYRNNSNNKKSLNNHYIQIKLIGDSLNKDGLGAWIELHYDSGKIQVLENTPYRGYFSTTQNIAHFGLGNISIIDTVLIKWPGGKMSVLKNVKTNQLLEIRKLDANSNYSWGNKQFATNTFFTEITEDLSLNIAHNEKDFIDFNIQRLLPHKLSEYGPALAAGDINGDKIDDIVMGGSYGYSTKLIIQQANGKFTSKDLLPNATRDTKPWEDAGILLFDADKDGDLDIYIASGSNEQEANSTYYQDHLWINDGKGNFRNDSLAIPVNYTSKSCVRAADFDNDGDLDIFVGGFVIPGKYPKDVSSFIYRNDSKNGKIKFTDVTAEVAKNFIEWGLCKDALWTDFDNDGWIDLVVASEWKPLSFFKNENGKFRDITAESGVQNYKGWWNSIVCGDFDNDGDMDYIVGNVGKNSFYRASTQEPVKIYAGDFDKNGSYDALPTVWLPNNYIEAKRMEFPAHGRDELIEQMIEIRRKFNTYHDFANAGFDKILSPEQIKTAFILEANDFNSCIFINNGKGKFECKHLPFNAQLSAVFGMQVCDADADGNLDLLLVGNDYGVEVSVGRYDALNGLLLKGDGKGEFTALSILQSGFYVPGNAKSLIRLRGANEQTLFVAAQNQDTLKAFMMKHPVRSIPLSANDRYAMLKLKNGKVRREEFNYGSSFFSQSSRFLMLNNQIQSIKLVDVNGNPTIIPN